MIFLRRGLIYDTLRTSQPYGSPVALPQPIEDPLLMATGEEQNPDSEGKKKNEEGRMGKEGRGKEGERTKEGKEGGREEGKKESERKGQRKKTERGRERKKEGKKMKKKQKHWPTRVKYQQSAG